MNNQLGRKQIAKPQSLAQMANLYLAMAWEFEMSGYRVSPKYWRITAKSIRAKIYKTRERFGQ